MSELDSDSDVTVQENNEDQDEDETELTTTDKPPVDLGSSEGQGEGHLKVDDTLPEQKTTKPWFVRPPSNFNVCVGRTLSCECVVSGQQPIG